MTINNTKATSLWTINDRVLLLGGSWRIVDSPSEAKALRLKKSRQGAGIAFELKHTPIAGDPDDADSNQRSVCFYDVDHKAGARLYSAGALVATLAPDVFVCKSLDSSAVWVFAAINGRPLPGFDKVVRPDEVYTLRKMAELGGDQLRLVGDMPDCELTLEKLIENEPRGVSAAIWEAALLKSKRQVLLPLAGGLALGAIVSFGVVHRDDVADVAKRAWTQLPFASADASRAAMKPMPTPPRPVVAASAPNAAASAVAAAVIPRRSASGALRTLMDALHAVPSSVEGWIVESAACKTDAPECQLVWSPLPGALPDGASSIPGVNLSVDDIMSKQVRARLGVDFRAGERREMEQQAEAAERRASKGRPPKRLDTPPPALTAEHRLAPLAVTPARAEDLLSFFSLDTSFNPEQAGALAVSITVRDTAPPAPPKGGVAAKPGPLPLAPIAAVVAASGSKEQKPAPVPAPPSLADLRKLRIEASGPLWQYRALVDSLNSTAITVDQLTLTQLADGEPLLRMSATAYVHRR